MSDTNTAAEPTPREKVASVMAKHGLTISSEFVPFSKSRNATPKEGGKVWRSLNWKVTLRRKTEGPELPLEGRPILTTDYAAGEAHCPSYKQGARRTIDYVAALDYEIEHGKRALVSSSFGVMARDGAKAKTVEPDACDVLHSLVLDSDVLNYANFENWADDFGYNADSRKAEATYRACLEIALKLRNGLGEAVIAELRDAMQDY